MSALSTREGLFQPSTLWGFPLQSFSPPRRSNLGFPRSFHACTSEKNPPAFLVCFRGFLPPEKPSPFCALRRINSERDPELSWGFSPPRSSPDHVEEKSLSLFSFPSRPLSPETLRPPNPGTSGFLVRDRSAFPPVRGAVLLGVPHRRSGPTSLEVPRMRTIFSSQNPALLTKNPRSLFASQSLPPFGRWHPRFGAKRPDLGCSLPSLAGFAWQTMKSVPLRKPLRDRQPQRTDSHWFGNESPGGLLRLTLSC
jgi:hypothetical protein